MHLGHEIYNIGEIQMVCLNGGEKAESLNVDSGSRVIQEKNLKKTINKKWEGKQLFNVYGWRK